jgi:hypothetical protein
MATTREMLMRLALFACLAGGLTLIVLGFVGSEDKFNVGMLGGGVALIVVPIIGYVCLASGTADGSADTGNRPEGASCAASYSSSSQGGNVVSAVHIVKYGRV